MARTDLPSRNEVTERKRGNAERLEEKIDDLEVIARDNEITADTLDNLEFSGTDDGSREVEGLMREAQDVTLERFEGEDQALDSYQLENREFETEMGDRAGTSAEDLERVNDAARGVDTREAVERIQEAAEAVTRDMEFLQKVIEEALANREASEQEQLRLESMIRR